VQDHSQAAVTIPRQHRSRVGVEIVRQFQKRGIRVLCASIAESHAHLLAELPVDLTASKRVVGSCKGASSHSVSDVLPGNLWSEGVKFELIKDLSHHRNVYHYILYKQGAGAFT
jgi:hypothetical protein